MDVDLGTVIAERKFSLQGGGDVVVRLGKPELLPDGKGAYYCPFQIVGAIRSPVRFAVGEDALQALELVFYAIDGQLAFFQRTMGCKLTWECGVDEEDLGFPPLENLKADIRDKIARRERRRDKS